MTADVLVQGVHFDARLRPEDVGYKAVAVNVSDLAAMGARPAWMVLSLCLASDEPSDVAALAEGLGEAAARWSVGLIGGDTTRSPGPRVVAITMGGALVGAPVTRAGARPGDLLWVSGTLGLAGAGYLLDDPPPAALAALRRPDPPLALALALAAAALPTAMMDLSDGLASDLPRLCRSSGVGARVDPSRLPVDAALARLDDPVPLQVAAGDDYELLFTTPPEAGDAVRGLAAGLGRRVTQIGEVTATHPVVLVGRPWPTPAFSHFGDVS